MDKKDGGSAFPHERGYDFKGERVVTASSGMSLRDYFAAAALTGFLANDKCVADVRTCAIQAYTFADAMLAARESNG